MMELWLQICSCVLAIFTAALNGFVSYMILSRAQLHNTANWFVLSLAVADLGVGLSSIPAAFTCKESLVDCDDESWYSVVMWFFISASITNLCCVVADRYVCIVRPLRYPELISKKRAIVVITVAWAIAFSYRLVYALLYNLSEEKLGASGRTIHQIFAPLWASALLVLPSIFLTVTTGHAIYVSRKLARQRAVLLAQINFNHPREPSIAIMTAENEARIKSSTMIMGTVVCCFIVCYSVDSYTYLCDKFSHCTPSSSSKAAYSLLILINSAFNPIAYSMFKKDIRAEVKRSFCSSEALP